MEEPFKFSRNVNYKEKGLKNRYNSEKKGCIKLFIIDILQLQQHPEVENCYIFCGLPIHMAYVCGVITNTNHLRDKMLYLVDDGSGAICCLYNHSEVLKFEATISSFNIDSHSKNNTPPSDIYETSELQLIKWIKDYQQRTSASSLSSPFKVGDSIIGRGNIKKFKGDICLWLSDVRKITDINDETNWKVELFNLYFNVYKTKCYW